MQTIGDAAFWLCESLTEIVFPDSLQTIGGGAFYACDLKIIAKIDSAAWKYAEAHRLYCMEPDDEDE